MSTHASATDWIVPASLRPGDVVRAIAPSSPFDARLVWRALGWLSERYTVRWSRRVFSRRGYLAGSDDARRLELEQALSEPDVKAVFCARGGYGANRFVHRVDWKVMRNNPRWLVGFSDVTALHVEAWRVGVATVHGPNLTGLGRADALARAEVVATLERTEKRRHTVRARRAGRASGRLVGGNLCLLHSCATAGRLRLPAGSVLLLEEVGERPYRVDRMISTLLVGGHLDGVAAVVIGDLDRCTPPGTPAGDTAEDVLVRCLAPLGVPVVAGLPVGHAVRNEPVVFGSRASVVAAEDEGPAALVLGGP